MMKVVGASTAGGQEVHAMGRWLEMLREKPQVGADSYTQRRHLIIAEIAPHPLLWAGRCLDREHRKHFPALDRVREGSPAYVDEWLWLDARQVGELLDELRRIRRIARQEEYLTGMHGRRYYDLWRRGDSPEEFEEWLDKIEQVLTSEGGHWALLSL